MKFKKDPNAVLDYLVDFAAKTNGNGSEDYLQLGETITAHTITSSDPIALVVDSSSVINTNTSVLVWLSGGVVGTTYTVTTRITTSLGRVDDRSFQVQVVEK